MLQVLCTKYLARVSWGEEGRYDVLIAWEVGSPKKPFTNSKWSISRVEPQHVGWLDHSTRTFCNRFFWSSSRSLCLCMLLLLLLLVLLLLLLHHLRDPP